MSTQIHNLKIYFDTCCLSRLNDNPTHAQIQQEAAAVETILDYCSMGQWFWIGSEVLVFEVNNTQNQSKRLQIQSRLNYVRQNVLVNFLMEILRARHLESLGFKQADALHLACAESSNVDVFLTTDNGILRRAERFSSQIQVSVENPYEWLQEIIRDEYPEKNRQ